jgi:plastocyanin
MSSREDLVAGVRLRVPLIVAIPVGALVVIGGAAYGFSRILLALEPEAATAVALTMALNVLIACAIVAYKPRLDTVTLAELFVVMTYPIVIGIVLANIGFGEAAEGGHDTQTAAGQVTGLQLAAAGVAFDTNELDLPAGEETTLPFNNEDSVPHNFSIYEDDSASKDLFTGAEVAGGSSTDYSIPPLDKGEYFFRCDLHPSSMTGTVVVE